MSEKKSIVKRYRLVLAALVVSAVMVGGAFYLAGQKKTEQKAQAFDTATVLPPEIKQQADTSTVYTADSLRQYDGKDGHACYVAVKGAVYEIKDSKYWQNGEHTPSSGRGICGGDMTEAIKAAPHGESMLERLPKVGTYQ